MFTRGDMPSAPADNAAPAAPYFIPAWSPVLIFLFHPAKGEGTLNLLGSLSSQVSYLKGASDFLKGSLRYSFSNVSYPETSMTWVMGEKLTDLVLSWGQAGGVPSV